MTVRIGRDLAGRPTIVRADRPRPASRPGLARQDLERAIECPARMGTVGYSERDDCGANQRLRRHGDAIVLREANRQGWTFADLVFWVDSKYGRWFWDELYGCNDEEGAARCVTLDWAADGTEYAAERRFMAEDIAALG